MWPAFVAASALGAALLFLIQPMVARVILPWFGGTPAVWTTCLLFFQSALLVGYAWAHQAGRRRRGVGVHLALVGLTLASPVLPELAGLPASGASPVGQILALLSASVGLPFMALAATAPLLQARAAAAGAGEVHRLYGWSNAGSLAGLLAYPLVLQPLVGVAAQGRLWWWGYLGFVVLLALALWPGRHAPPAAEAEAGAPPAPGDRARWLLLSLAGCTLLLTVTEALSQDLSVTPLLWVLPLGLYLGSFILAFGRERWVSRRLFGPLLVGALAGFVALLHLGYRAHWAVQLGGWCAALFIACTFCHGELVRRRPGPGFLTGFYLWIAAGGALAGVLVGVVAPQVLPLGLELHGAVLGTWGLWLWTRPSAAGDFRARDGQRLVALGLGLLLAAGLGLHAWQRARGAELFRSFFGMLQVKRYTLQTGRELVHLLDGRISHGFQFTDEARRRRPTAYFAPETGVGRLLSLPGPARAIGVVGLGAGTLAAYGRPGDRVRFYEINPDVVAVARTRFTWLADSAAAVSVAEGDGRRLLADEAPQGDWALVLDAFSGDAIPTHLITREALALYLGHLRPEGFLAVNVSNRHAALWRVVAGLAAEAGLSWVFIRHVEPSPLGPYQSDWMILAREARLLDPLRAAASVPEGGPPLVWTDDFAPLLPLLRSP
ncbi:MAG: fused MFS/spermidine synthase [bacterium]